MRKSLNALTKRFLTDSKVEKITFSKINSEIRFLENETIEVIDRKAKFQRKTKDINKATNILYAYFVDISKKNITKEITCENENQIFNSLKSEIKKYM